MVSLIFNIGFSIIKVKYILFIINMNYFHAFLVLSNIHQSTKRSGEYQEREKGYEIN